MALHRFVAYYPLIQTAPRTTQVVDLETQKRWVNARVHEHPNGVLIEAFTEEWSNITAARQSNTFPKLEDAVRFSISKNAHLMVVLQPEVKNPHMGKYLDSKRDPQAITRIVHGETQTDGFTRGELSYLYVRMPANTGIPVPRDWSSHEQTVWTETPITVPGYDWATFDLNAVWSLIKRDCGSYLAKVKKAKYILFQGILEHDESALFEFPLTSLGVGICGEFPELSSAAQWMEEKGFHANLGNSIIASGDNQLAERQISFEDADSKRGLYAIFPCDGFEFAWARNYRQITSYIPSGGEDLVIGEPEGEALQHRLWKCDWVKHSFEDALKSGHEILVGGAPYYALLWKDFRETITTTDLLKNRKVTVLGKRQGQGTAISEKLGFSPKRYQNSQYWKVTKAEDDRLTALAEDMSIFDKNRAV